MADVYAPMAEAMNRLVDDLTEKERRAITRWLTATVEILRESTEAVQSHGSRRPRADAPAERG